MNSEAIIGTLDQMALDLSMMDLGDLRDLVALQSQFEEWAGQADSPLAGVSAHLSQICLNIVYEEVDDENQAVETLGLGLEVLQDQVRGRDPGEKLEKLGMDETGEGGEERAESENFAALEAEAEVDAAEVEKLHPEHDDLFESFVTEAYEHLENAEQALLELQSDAANEETLNGLFRSFHTIKGAAGFVNMLDLGDLTHAAENLLDLARKQQLELDGDRIDALFEAIDVTRGMIACEESEGEKGEPPDHTAHIARLKQFWQALLILVEAENCQYCLLVDDLIGIQQIVIKGIEERMRSKGVAGSAILGDGHIGLILDVDGVYQASLAKNAPLITPDAGSNGWTATEPTLEEDREEAAVLAT